MKVLMISEYFPPNGKGGGEISTSLLAGALAEKGVDIHILTSFFKGCIEFETLNKVKVHRRLKTGTNPSSFFGNFERNLFFRKSLLKELALLDKEEDFDIIQCMNSTSVAAIELKEKLKKKFILHANSPVLFCPKGTLMYKDKMLCNKKCDFMTFLSCYNSSRLFGKMRLNLFLKCNPAIIYAVRKPYSNYQKQIKRFDHYMAISSFLKERLEKAGVDKKKIDVVYNVVELDRFIEARKEKKEKRRMKKILYLGEYSSPKGADILLDALTKVSLPYSADFFGEGVLLKELKSKSENFPIHINNKAPYGDIPKIIGSHDIIVVPSLVGEGFSRVALEAVAAGKIVVAARIGGIIDIINEKNGFLFDDLKDLPKKIEEAMKSDITPVFEEKFEEKEIVKKVIDIYKKIV